MNINIPYQLLGDFETCDTAVFLISQNGKWLFKYELTPKDSPDFFRKEMEYISIPIEYIVAAEKEAIYFYTCKDGKWSDPIEFQPEIMQLRKKNSSFDLIIRGEGIPHTQDAINLLDFIKEGVDIINEVELAPIGSKNLLYYVLNYDKSYLSLLDYSLRSLVHFTPDINFDLLIITPSGYVEDIEKLEVLKKFKYDFMYVPHAETGIKASMNKLKIYSYDKINEYRKILYLDTDIFIKSNLKKIFDEEISDGKLYSSIHKVKSQDFLLNNVFHNIVTFTEEELDCLKARNIQAFNAGQYLFLNSNKMKAHFQNLNILVDRWKWTYFFEQSFLNYYFNKYEISDVHKFLDSFTFQTLELEYDSYSLLKRDCVTIHFLGQATKSYSKLQAMKELYNKLCLT